MRLRCQLGGLPVVATIRARAAARRHAVVTVWQAGSASASMPQFPHGLPDAIYSSCYCSARRETTSNKRNHGKMRRTEVFAALIMGALAIPAWGQNIQGSGDPDSWNDY